MANPRRNILFALLMILGCLLTACSLEAPVFVTATPIGTPAPIVVTQVPDTPIVIAPDPTVDVTPTAEERWNPHRDCAERIETCYVNVNPFLVDGKIRHSLWNGRNTDVPQGYLLKTATADTAPFIYCYVRYLGCQFEFQWLDGAMGYQTEPITLYSDVVYLVKLRYSLDAACSQRNNCTIDQLSTDMLVFIDNERYRFESQPVTALHVENQEALWAIYVESAVPVEAHIQAFLSVQWATFAEPAKFIIHEIGVIALPEDFDGFVYSLS